MADGVDGHAPCEQPLDEVVQSLTLAGLLGVVVVDRQHHWPVAPGRRVHLVEGLVGIREGEIDVLLAEHVVPPAAAQPVGLGGAVGDDLVDDVPRDERIGIAPERPVLGAERLGDREDVVAHAVAQDRPVGLAGGERCAGVGLEEPGRRLAVPDERVPVDVEAVGMRRSP